MTTSSLFQILKELPTPISQSQCVLYKQELLVCGGWNEKNCYSYHTIKNEYKFICEYPKDVKLFGHCVVKLLNNKNKDNNEITLLSFGGYSDKKHTLIMKYKSVWNNDENNKLHNYNKWVPFKDNNNNTIDIGGYSENYQGACALIGGNNNNLLFITYRRNNISIYNLKTFKCIKHDNLPIKSDWICNEMILFCECTGLLIKYDEYNNIFQFNQLPVCDAISSFKYYAYVYINNYILFFGGWTDSFDEIKVFQN
ncbi:hypothetical protein RFI_24844 [Reticulomyxa filosa]|uniref:Uncharacterized protein n=1 Tax=Reticulomyxa filosa TaxID=46433 RepID=X6MF68_RETFI|nr:hypothetical protein RFI_24844 [Reticulomyxa filosa]|eukprot:ETO12529.1 hypothetical protein RFI_24844 [Reticulomyxa filosa]